MLIPSEAVMGAIRSFNERWLREIFYDQTHDKVSVSAVRADVDNLKHCFDEAADINILTECFNHVTKKLSYL
jgi:hypothetical protein